MIHDTTLLQPNHQYLYKRQTLIVSHSSTLARGAKAFVFRSALGSWKHLSRNQLREVSTVEPLREGFVE